MLSPRDSLLTIDLPSYHYQPITCFKSQNLIIPVSYGCPNRRDDVKIAICDDDKAFCYTIKDAIVKFDAELNVSIFEDGEALISSYEEREHPFDVLFLDIEMPLVNGLDAGKEIRSKDQDVFIVILSAYPRYSLPAYELHPFHFLVKPIRRYEFYNICKNILVDQYPKLPKLMIQQSSNRILIPVNKILYIQKIDRKTVVFTMDEDYACYKTLSRFKRKLKEKTFLKSDVLPLLTRITLIIFIHQSEK